MPQPQGAPPQPDQASQSSGDESQANNPATIGDDFSARRLQTPLDKMTRSSAGRRSYTKTDRKRGRYIQARPSNGKADDLAFDATLRAAAPHQKERTEQRKRQRIKTKSKPSRTQTPDD